MCIALITEKIKLKTAKTVAVASRNLEVGRPGQLEDPAGGGELRARSGDGGWECWGAVLARESLGRGKKRSRVAEKKKTQDTQLYLNFR